MVTFLFFWLNEFFRSKSIPWKCVIAAALISKSIWELTLNALNYRMQFKKEPSKEAVETLNISKKEHMKTQEYTKSYLLLDSFRELYNLAFELFYLRYNVIANSFYFFRAFLAMYLPAKYLGDTAVAVVVFIMLSLANGLRNPPMEYYEHFVIEERFGFNNRTVGIFIKDVIKNNFITILFMSLFNYGASKIVEITGNHYILYISAFIVGLFTVMQVIFPTLIIPWFYKLRPLEQGQLRTKVENLAKEHGFPSENIHVMDGGSRSSHSNAFFIGLPWLKEIFLYDTLIENHNEDEIISVLAHELGHWKLNHIPILMLTEVSTMAFQFIPLTFFLKNTNYFESIGFKKGDTPTLVAILTYSSACAASSVVVKFVGNFVIRTCEYAADRFAVRAGHGRALIEGVVVRDKKSLLAPEEHKLYTAYHHSHPPALNRIQALNLVMRKPE